MTASRSTSLRRLVLVFDAFLVVGAMGLAAGLHAALRDHVDMLKEPPQFEEYALLVYLCVPLWVTLIALLGLHRVFEREWTRLSLAIDVAKLHVLGFLAVSTIGFFVQATINRSLVILFLATSTLVFYGVRSGFGVWQRYQHRTEQSREQILVVGGPSWDLDAFLTTIAGVPRPPRIVGQLGATPIPGVEHLGTLEDLPRVLHDRPIDRVLFFPPHHHAADVAPAIAGCEILGVSAELAIETVQQSLARPTVIDVHGQPFISFDATPKPPERLALKHAFDWIASALGLVMLSPVFLVVSLAILVTMGRPIFFVQDRAGLFGRTFRMLKFRTMVKDAEARRDALTGQNEMSGPVFKVTNDPRITRLGAFLRKTSIDELPQLLNVFLGSMSLVGPRPLPIKEQQAIKGWHRKRLAMKPGITGIWQVSGRNNIDFEEWMRLDQQYVDDWTLRLDLLILAKTVPTVLFGRGAK